ncbi:MAG: RNA-binding protein [archaeon]
MKCKEDKMKLHVGNLAFSVDEEALEGLFKDYETAEITIIKDKFSGRSKGFAFVTIEDDEVAKKAISELNGKDFEGRELRVSEAKPMEDRPPRRDFNRSRGGGGGGGGGGRGGGRDFNQRRRF